MPYCQVDTQGDGEGEGKGEGRGERGDQRGRGGGTSPHVPPAPPTVSDEMKPKGSSTHATLALYSCEAKRLARTPAASQVGG